MSALPAAIKHIVVLMLENRSFDHLLGSLSGVAGPSGRSNVDPLDGSIVPISFDASSFTPALPHPDHPDRFEGDPLHDVVSVNRQLFETATPDAGTPVTCGGFIQAAREGGDAGADRAAREVMRCFDAQSSLPTAAALAAAFVVCDSWFSSVPGPTWPNRLFAHAGTSFGSADNKLRLYPGPTLYDCLDDARVDWAIYYHDIPQSACFRGLRSRRDSHQRKCMRHVSEFFKDVRAAGTLPSYVFIEPNYFESGRGLWGYTKEFLQWLLHLLGFPVYPSMEHANDQHPPHDIRLGEHLIADVYDALRANDELWRSCVYIVLHDEHGGLFDHGEPPAVNPPDGNVSANPPFDFQRLGLRVPAFIVSPWVRHMVDHTQYEHTSIVRTVREHFCPETAPITNRDATANPLNGEMFLSAPKSTPTIGRPVPTFLIGARGDPEKRPMNDLQASLVNLANAMAPGGPADLDERAVAVAPRPVDAVIDLSDTPAPQLTEASGRRIVTAVMARERERR